MNECAITDADESSTNECNEADLTDPDESGQYLEQATAAVKATLNDIFVNIQSRLDPKNLDTNFFTGVVKFTERYQKLSEG